MVKVSAICALLGLASTTFAALPLNALERKVKVSFLAIKEPNSKID